MYFMECVIDRWLKFIKWVHRCVVHISAHIESHIELIFQECNVVYGYSMLTCHGMHCPQHNRLLPTRVERLWYTARYQFWGSRRTQRRLLYASCKSTTWFCRNTWAGLTPRSWGSIFSMEKEDWGPRGVLEDMKKRDKEAMREEWGLHWLLYQLQTWWHKEQNINKVWSRYNGKSCD